jgi:transglutaminase-like putative cysteine protease
MGAAILMAATPSPSAAEQPAEPPGASLAFTSNDPAVLRARDLLAQGKFKEAEATLGEGHSDRSALAARTEMREIMRRIRYEYSLDADALLRQLRQTLPDCTAEEAIRWATEAKVRYRLIDGQKFFYRRAARNIFLFSEAAGDRRNRAGKAPADSDGKLIQHLGDIVAEAERSGEVQVQPVQHRVTHTITLHRDAPGLKVGATVRAWLPYPQEYRQQRDVRLISSEPEVKLIAPKGVDGCPVGGAPQRSAFFEQQVADPARPITFKLVFEYTSFAYYPQLDEAKVQPLPAGWGKAFLGERPPHITLGPEVRGLAKGIIGTETNTLARARKIFRWVSANIPWNAEDEYCILPSLTAKGLAERRGDCGVQNTVFISLCRAAGIPARWQSGFETKPGEAWGMHDWSEIYLAPWGWLPADASYGVKKSTDPRIADFYCGHQDSYRLIVNLDWGRELFPPKASMRSEPADFQRGEVEVDGQNLYFDQWDYQMEVERKPLPSPRAER